MTRISCFLIVFFITSCTTTKYYVVRHAEKETSTMTTDVPLSAEGQQRAQSLKQVLINENIRFIYSTNFVRTKSTAQPLAEAKNIVIRLYDPRDTGFVSGVKNTIAGNVLIVGHSNTVDDLINNLMGKQMLPGDLPDTQYGDLFIVKKKGKKYSFQKGHFGM